jgi:uncharacterized membrane protein YgcG
MFKCPKCRQTFSYEPSFKSHLRGHGLNPDRIMERRSSFSDDLIDTAVDVGVSMLVSSLFDSDSSSSSSFDWSGGGGDTGGGGASGDW